MKLILKRRKTTPHQKPKISTCVAHLHISISNGCSKKNNDPKTTNLVASSNTTLLFYSVGFQTCEVGGQGYVPFGGTRRESVPYPFPGSRLKHSLTSGSAPIWHLFWSSPLHRFWNSCLPLLSNNLTVSGPPK